MTGWKTWTGVISALVASLALFLGVELTQAQLDGIQMLILAIIGYGLGHKTDRVGEAVQKTKAVAMDTNVQAKDLSELIDREVISKEVAAVKAEVKKAPKAKRILEDPSV